MWQKCFEKQVIKKALILAQIQVQVQLMKTQNCHQGAVNIKRFHRHQAGTKPKDKAESGNVCEMI